MTELKETDMFEGRRQRAVARIALLGSLCLTGACVVDAPAPAGTEQTEQNVKTTKGPLLPLAQGNTWTYSVKKQGEESTKVLLVESEEEIGGEGPSSGVVAFKITTTKDDKPDAVAWQALAAKRVLRYREQELSGKTGEVKSERYWEPGRLQVDGNSDHTASGASWVEEFAETKIEDGKEETTDESDTWSVDAVDEVVTVPAGTFTALVLRRGSGSKAKTLWFVKGVGKVKEDGDELEELVAYQVEP
jgi:hypothetical protein